MASQAIVVGINDYQHHPERALNYAVNDAQRMSDFLTQQAGFEQVFLCLGDQAHRTSPTYPTCSRLLDLLQNQLDPSRLSQKIDRLWFYFSGHGVSQNGRDYLITSDCLEDKIDRFGLPIDEVIALLRQHKDTDIVLILDACRQVLGKKSFEAAIGEQTLATAKERGITTIFSCDYGQFSYELEALQQGAFTHALIDGLAKHTLPIQLEAYLRQQVQALNSQHQKRSVTQIPKIQIDSVSKTFQSLLPHRATASDIEILIKCAIEDELEGKFAVAKRLWWQALEALPSRELVRQAKKAIDRIDQKIMQGRSPVLNSEKSIDYTKLRDLLNRASVEDQSELWKAADQETYQVMIRAVGKKSHTWFSSEELLNFPCADLKTIDALWLHFSQGRFGFSVQKQIYVECGATLDGKYPGDAVWEKFGERVGWRKDGSWLYNSELEVSLSSSQGTFPWLGQDWELWEGKEFSAFAWRFLEILDDLEF